jgi:hypothetical protein
MRILTLSLDSGVSLFCLFLAFSSVLRIRILFLPLADRAFVFLAFFAVSASNQPGMARFNCRFAFALEFLIALASSMLLLTVMLCDVDD